MHDSENEILERLQEVEKGSAEAYSLALIFHENTKYSAVKNMDDFMNIGLFRANPATLLASMRSFKEYHICEERIPLPSIPELLSDEHAAKFDETLIFRRSVRSYTGKQIPFRDFARMLILSYGITGSVRYDNGEDLFLRASPSAGGLYPLEVYAFALCVEGLQPGLYHYNVRDNLLELVKRGNFREDLAKIMQNQPMIDTCSALIGFTYLFERVLIKYRNRGMRFVYLDAGHLAQNMSLVASASGLGSCMIGGFNDYEFEALLGIDGLYESAVYSLVVGDPA